MLKLIAALVLSSSFALASAAPKAELSTEEIKFKYEKIFAHKEIPEIPLIRVLKYYDANLESIQNKNYITVVNYGLDSNVPRMFLIDMRDGNVEALLVAHGSGSDPRKTGRARLFSNVVDSDMSSLGIFYTGRPFSHKHPHSLHLYGLESTNNKAYERAILVHDAVYVSENRRVEGTSEGCLAVEEKVAAELIDKIKLGSVIITWIDPSLIARPKAKAQNH